MTGFIRYRNDSFLPVTMTTPRFRLVLRYHKDETLTVDTLTN
jgi:hypothetical protein